MSTEQPPRSWYREPWPWIVMSGPAVVVCASIATAVIAVETSDPLVAEDYYQRGLAINTAIAREERAQALGLAATVEFDAARDRVRVTITKGEAPSEPPRLTLVHATRAGVDQAVTLRTAGPGRYEGAVRIPVEGAWRVRLEDAAASWRLSGHWSGIDRTARLAPAV